MSDEPQGERTSCLDAVVLASFLENSLRAEAREQTAQHLVECHACRDKLTEQTQLGEHETQDYSSVVLDEAGTALTLPAASAGTLLTPGTSLGRYVVLGKVGSGGMGVVYSAFDPELERQIAIKVIRAEILGDMERAHANLRDEARAMAQLTHPNVVRVYDVGTQGELVYIAMEFVEGEDLLQFAKRQQKRGDWKSIFDACMDAGRGLQAAHDAGLVHRDFKPSNVLVSTDGRVFVADFGLTRLFSKATEGGSVGWTSASGTPGYAAPEQLAGEPSNTQSDQYSYCVTLAQCLFGRDPMSIFTRLDREDQGELKTPKRFAPLLQRGLSAKASDRHPSMQALLDQLQEAGRIRKTGVIALAGASALLAVGVFMFVLGGRSADAVDVCSGGAEPFEKLWSPERQNALQAVVSSGKYGKQSSHFFKTASALSGDIVKEQRLSCEATYKQKTQSEELFDLQMFCLNSHATDFDGIISMVEEGASVEAGQTSLGAMRSVAECRTTESLRNMKEPPSDENSLKLIKQVEVLLAERRALKAERKPEEALARVEAAIASSRVIGYGPLTSRAESQRALLLADLERYSEARQAAERARDAASEGRDTRRVILALLQLSTIVRTHEDDADEAKAYLATARSLGLGMELPTIDKVEIEIASGTLAQANGDHVAATAFANAGLALLEPAEAKTQADVSRKVESEIQGAKIMLLEIIAAAHFSANELDKASPLIRKIHKLKEERLGPGHSGLAVSLTNIATVEYQLGKPEEALATLQEVRELLKSPDSTKSDLGQVLSMEALIQNRLGKLPEAVELFKETIEVYKELFGEDHPNIWRTKANLANTLMALERWDETLEIQRGFAAWATERYGPSNPTAINAKLNLASTNVQVHYEDGEVQEGQRLLSELAAELPKGHPTLVNIRVMQGNAFLARKEYGNAASSFELALKLNETTPNPEPSFVATTSGAFADALWQAGKKKRALSTARRALALYDELGPGVTDYRTEQEKWIKEKESER
jgi:serine/threonine protein kinase